LIAVIPSDKTRIYHFCGFDKKQDNIEAVAKDVWDKLMNDEAMKLEPMLLMQMELREAPQNVLDHFNKILIEEVHPQIRKKMEEENESIPVKS